MLSDRLFYGRRLGKGFSPAAATSLKTQARDLCFDDPRSLVTAPCTHRLLEIGFGNGAHLLAQAMAHPETLCVGVEAYQTGFTLALREAYKNSLPNIRLANSDIALLLAELPEAFFDQIFILFPDPWPKTRQQKRRLVTEAFLKRLKPTLKPGGFLVTATDDAHYAQQIRDALESAIPGDWQMPEPLILTTPYQQKALNAGREIVLTRRGLTPATKPHPPAKMTIPGPGTHSTGDHSGFHSDISDHLHPVVDRRRHIL
jgi:tRNA (guanine-N7-)-methyltransferase